ncbi:hypothetical protein FD755_017372, partial [Muntiacus reevesi]
SLGIVSNSTPFHFLSDLPDHTIYHNRRCKYSGMYTKLLPITMTPILSILTDMTGNTQRCVSGSGDVEGIVRNRTDKVDRIQSIKSWNKNEFLIHLTHDSFVQLLMIKKETPFPCNLTYKQTMHMESEVCQLSHVPTITWMKVNGYIPSKSRLRKSQAVLEIPNVQLDDAGTYECRAENSRGKNSFRGQLQVYTYPHWAEKLNDTQLDSGSPLRWECKATGKPRPTYRWLKNGVPLLPQSRVEMVNGVLMIHNVNQSDAGMYQCLAENKYRTIYASAELKILASAPTFALNQLKKTIIIPKDQEVIIECKPQGSPKPTISWKKGDKAVRENKRLEDFLPYKGLSLIHKAKADLGNVILNCIVFLFLKIDRHTCKMPPPGPQQFQNSLPVLSTGHSQVICISPWGTGSNHCLFCYKYDSAPWRLKGRPTPKERPQPFLTSSFYVNTQIIILKFKGLPGWLSSKESACNAGAVGDRGSIPGLGRSPGGGHFNPIQYYCSIYNLQSSLILWVTVEPSV